MSPAARYYQYGVPRVVEPRLFIIPGEYSTSARVKFQFSGRLCHVFGMSPYVRDFTGFPGRPGIYPPPQKSTLKSNNRL